MVVLMGRQRPSLQTRIAVEGGEEEEGEAPHCKEVEVAEGEEELGVATMAAAAAQA